MKKNTTLLLLFLLFIGSTGFGSDYKTFITFTKSLKNSGPLELMEGKLPAALLDSLDLLYEKSPYRYHFYEMGGKIFVQLPCTFDLYEVQGTKLVNKYRYFNQGYTCGTTPLVRDSTHYLLGGHGFWRNHMDLMVLDERHGSWELVLTKNQPANYFSSFVYQNSKGLVALFGGTYNQRHGIESKNPNGYFLDWESKTWKEVEVKIEGVDLNELAEKGGLFFIQTQDYAFWATTNGLTNIGWNLIEKESGKLFYFDSKNVDMGLSPFLEVNGNVLRYATPSGEIKSLDLDELRQESKEVGSIQPSNKVELDGASSWGYGLFIMLVALGGLLVFKIIPRYRKEKTPSLPSKKLDPLQLLVPLSGQLLTTETLDQLLGIDGQANFDSRRMKRARLINDINEQYLEQAGKELIVRDKKPEDKRYVYYKIQA